MLRAWSSPFLGLRTGRYWLGGPLPQIDLLRKSLKNFRRFCQRHCLKKTLFICCQNRLRSPTPEQVFADYPGLEVSSAGTNHLAENPLTVELVSWADIIVVMERQHRAKVQRRFRMALRGQRIICLDIPDDYEFMQPELVELIGARMARHLPPARSWTSDKFR